MLTDTHCHINLMIKKKFDVNLTKHEVDSAKTIIQDAHQENVKTLVTIGTSLVESSNCIKLAQHYPSVFAVVGIHPNDARSRWHEEFEKIRLLTQEKKTNKIVGIGETGLDFYWPNYNKQRQLDLFKAHIELSLENDLALVVHMRNAQEEVLHALEPYKKEITRGIMHCFSGDQSYADDIISLGFALGIGGIITYPKNTVLRSVVKSIPSNKIVLETDAPYLPPQIIRGKPNHPKYIKTIADYIANLREEPLDILAQQTTKNAHTIFGIHEIG